jgi:hypothetical protein
MASKTRMGHNLLELTQSTLHQCRQYNLLYYRKGHHCMQLNSEQGNQPRVQKNGEFIKLNASNFAGNYPQFKYN